MKKPLFLLLALPLFLQASSDRVIEQIVLAAPDAEVALSQEKIWVCGLNLPGPVAEIREKISPFLGKPLARETLLEIQQLVVDFFADHHHPLIAVSIPEQQVEKGRVKFEVVEPKLGEIKFSGNRWFSTRALSDAVDLHSGQPIREPTLLTNIAAINRNPFVHSDLIVSPGEKRHTSNLEIVTRDRFTLRLYAGADNTGSVFTQQERFFTGFNWSIGLHHLLTYQFMSADAFPDFLSHFLHYTAFLPWKHELVVYSGYAVLHPDIDDFDSKGKNFQGSFRYSIPLNALYQPFQHRFQFGYDVKYVNSSLFFLGSLPGTAPTSEPVFIKSTNLAQFYFGYHLETKLPKHQVTFHVETLVSPFKYLPNQTASNYNDLRQGASTRYIYSRVSLGEIYQLPKKFEAAALFRVQASSHPLLPSEQFGLGGYDTVRGYQEREFLADEAICLNGEIRSPALTFLACKSELRFLAFSDFGWGYNLKNSFAEGRVSQLGSVGAGMRYNIVPYLTSRLDYGFRLHPTEFGPKTLGRLHFSVIVGY